MGGPWDTLENIKWWSYLCYTNNAQGIIGHEFYERLGGIKDVANYSWNAIKVYNEPDNPDGPEEAREIDTDGDGLSDYDELTIFHTDLSEADTDGDGINDSQDKCPLCPGRNQMDFNEDCAVDLIDLMIFCESWLDCTKPFEEGCKNLLN